MNTWPTNDVYNMMNMPMNNMMQPNPMQPGMGNMPMMNDWNQMNPMINTAQMGVTAPNGGNYIPPLPMDKDIGDSGNKTEGQGGNKRDERNWRGRSSERNRDRSDHRGDRSRSDRRERRSKWSDNDNNQNQQPNNSMMMNNMGAGNMAQGNMIPYTNMMDMQSMSNINAMPNMSMNQMMPGMSMMPTMMDQNQMMMVQMQMMGQQVPSMPLSPIYISNGILLPPIPGTIPPARRDRPPGCRTIFIGGIPKNITKDAITEIFQRFGSITDVQMHRQGISHVRFEKPEAVEQSFFLSGYRYKLHDQSENEATPIFIDYALVSTDDIFASIQPVESTIPLQLADEVSENSSCTKKRRLTGASRKKLRKLLATGMSYDEAVNVVHLPMPDIDLKISSNEPKATKRSLEEDSSEIKPNKIQKLDQEAAPNYLNHSLKVGIRDKNPMTKDEMSLVHRAIIVAMTAAAHVHKVGEGPKFINFVHRTGWVMVTCKDHYSLEWLENEVPNLKPWPSAHLTIVKDLPKAMVGTLFIPKSETQTVEEALALIRLQNEGLETEVWRVLNVQSKEHGMIVSFSLDELSVEVLRATDYSVYLGFKKLQFRIKNDAESQPLKSATTFNEVMVESESRLRKHRGPYPLQSTAGSSTVPRAIAKIKGSSRSTSQKSLQPAQRGSGDRKGQGGVRGNNHDDQSEFEKNKRRREPTPPRVEPFSPSSLQAVTEKIKSDTDFAEVAPTLATWLERGECNKKNANTFYSLIQASNSQVRRLYNEKMSIDEEYQNMKQTLKDKLSAVIVQFEQVAKILSAAKHQRVSDHFSKQQRRNIEMWLHMTEDLENIREEFNTMFDENENETDVKNMVPMQKYEQLRKENENLNFELEGYKNEAHLAKDEAERKFEKFKAQFIAQQALVNKDNHHKSQAFPPLPPPPLPPTVPESAPHPPPPSSIPELEAKIISVLTAYLLAQPLGASLENLVSYVTRIVPTASQVTVNNVLGKYPGLFSYGAGGWMFVTFDIIKKEKA